MSKKITRKTTRNARRQVVLRLVPDVNRTVRAAAKDQEVSINALCEKILFRATKRYAGKKR